MHSLSQGLLLFMFHFYTLYEAVDFSRRKHQTATEMETDELTRCAVSAQLAIAHLQKVAYFADFQNRHPAKHITVAFHKGDILADFSHDFQNFFHAVHSSNYHE